jgi:transcriptional regulator with PAS, ATPase and Fis domain
LSEVASFDSESEEREGNRPDYIPVARIQQKIDEVRVVVSRDPKTEKTLSIAENVAATPSTVLLTGESGVGKEVFAHYIHRRSKRRDNPFVGINCAALPASLLESELFGHEEGAFTGASQQHTGVFEQANTGTLLLDEISEMPEELQAKLLRVIQERRVTRVGGDESIDLDIRLIATTNRDLKKWVEQGKFREDLYYRINVFPIKIPPLRKRRGDIEPLVRFYLAKFAGDLEKDIQGITPHALDCLESYPFPGNVRELLNVLERAVIMCSSGIVTESHLVLDSEVDSLGAYNTEVEEEEHIVSFKAGDESLTDVRKSIILRTLERFDGNRTKTAEALGVSTRTIRNKIADYREAGIEIPESRG